MNLASENLSFGKRHGLEPIEIPFQIDVINSVLRIELWNAYYIHVQQPLEAENTYSKRSWRYANKVLWVHFFKKALDDFPQYDSQFRDFIRQFIDHREWYKIYEFFEYVCAELETDDEFDSTEFEEYINAILRSNNSGYTLTNNKFIPIVNSTEVDEIKETQLLSKKHSITGVQAHLNSAIELLSQKPTPDYRNSIKESISMVESISRIIEPSENTLGKALSKLDSKNKINSTLRSGFEKLYAYTNNKNGIRHAIMDDESVGAEDAKFFLVACSAFTNYLVEKAIKEGLLSDIDNK